MLKGHGGQYTLFILSQISTYKVCMEPLIPRRPGPSVSAVLNCVVRTSAKSLKKLLYKSVSQ